MKYVLLSLNSARVTLWALCLCLLSFCVVPAAFGADFSLSWKAYRLTNETQGNGEDNNSKRVAVTITLTPPENTYIYGTTESSLGLPTSVSVRAIYSGAAGGERALSVLAPTPEKYTPPPLGNEPSEETLVYKQPATFLAFLPVKNGTITVNVQASGLICSDVSCLPFDKAITIPLSQEAIESLPATTANEVSAGLTSLSTEPVAAAVMVTNDTGEAFDFSFLTPVYANPGLEVTELGSAVLFGILAGLMLNLMPCVLPVISLKFSALMAVTAMTDKRQQAKAFRMHCLIFAAGVMTWFTILALLLGMAGLAWGELFQNSFVVSILGIILFLLALSLFNVFCLPIFDLKVASPSNPHWQAFASGLLATLLATPCSGPLLGGVLGWGVRQPLEVLLITVTSVGLGMSLPYCILAFHPRLVHLLPKPGRWTLRLEQLLGFFLMGSVAYLIFLLPPDWVEPYLITLVAIAFAAWLWGQIGGLTAGPLRRFLARTCAVLTILIAIWLGKASVETNFNWEPFDPYAFSTLLGKEALLVEFTADWCPSCKAMEHTTLSEGRMAAWRAKYTMRTIRVDLTRNDKVGKELLQALGSSSIPVIALFPKGEDAQKPLVLRDIVTPTQLEEALQRVFK